VILTISAVELLFAVFHPLPFAIEQAMYFQPDPFTGYRLKPLGVGSYQNGIPAIANSHGHRDDEVTLNKKPGTYRILVIGDSFTVGANVMQEEAYPQVLEVLLNQNSPVPTEVINSGVGGWESFHYAYWNEAGNDLAAELLFSYLKQKEPEQKIPNSNQHNFQLSTIPQNYSFLKNLEHAWIIAEDESYISRTEFTINNETRTVLFLHPDSKVTYQNILINKQAKLMFGIGVNQTAWDKAGDGVLFELSLINEESQNTLLFSQYIDPKNNMEDRKWFDVQVDLAALAGQKVTFIFETKGGPDNNIYFDWAGWSRPQVVSYNNETSEFVHLPDYGDMHQFDPNREGGHLLPNLNMLFTGERLDKPVRVITNSKGFRNNREFDFDVPEKNFRIMFLGDSFVDGMRTDQKQTIGHVLEDFLNRHNSGNEYDNSEVLISGHNNPANAWYYYQQHGYKYQPNLVILGVTLGNDLTWHNYKSGMLPVQDNAGMVNLKLSAPQVQQDLTGKKNMNLLLPPEAYTPESYWEFFQNMELAVRNFLARKFYSFGYHVPPMLGPNACQRRHVYAAGFLVSLGLFYKPIMPEIEQLFVDFEEVMMGLRDRVANSGSRFLIVLFPVRIQVSQKDWDLLVKAYSLDKKRFDLNYPNIRISRVCRKYGIECLDLLAAFKDHSKKGKMSLYRPRGDMHFNERGQQLAGRVIAEYVANLY
jgi:hypothetical protein